MSHKVTSSLLNYLENGDEVDRCYAAKTLGNLKVKEATQALLERIRDEDIDVCIDAITALGKIKESSAIPVLLESLEKDPDGDVKLAVTESLAHYKSDDAIDILLKLAEDRPEEMDFDQNADWDSWWDLQEKAIVILGEMKVQKAFPILKTVLEDDFSQDIEAIVLKAMARIGGAADEYLINRLSDNDSQSKEKEQRRTATALGFSQSKETLQALGRALISQSADTRENVLYALGRRKASQYIRAILLSLRDPDNNVKRAALEVIQELATEAQINQELDFNQVASLLSDQNSTKQGTAKQDVILQTAVLSFFQQQHKISPIVNTLTESNQQLLRQCLYSSDDNVITQAVQLAGVIGDTQSIEQLLNLAVSESHSAWVRKEAILALSLLLIEINEPSANKMPSVQQNALMSLRQLVHNKEQAVRFSAIQALLTLSNLTPSNQSKTDASEYETRTDDLPPIAILLATLRGEQFDLEAEETTEDSTAAASSAQSGTDDCSSCAKSDACSDNSNESESILQQFDEKNIEDSAHLIAANEEQPVSSALSTLDAILMDNVESARAVVPETAEQKAHDKDSGPFISEQLPEEMDEFVSIMRKNFAKGKKIIRRKINTFNDARHISARLLADNTQAQYDEMIINALAQCLNDDDEQLRQEAAESLAQISLKNPLIPGLSNTFGKLVTLLDSNDLDMRIACIHAISYSGNRAALTHLLDYLSDEEYLVRLHAVQGLVYILNNKANLSEAQQESFMILDEVSNATVIAALFDCLKDKNYSVSMAAIEALTELQQTEAIEQFIDVALTDEGQSARRISRLLKKLDTEKSTEMLLTRLDNVSDSSYRRYVMEMLEVVISPEADQLEAA